MAIIVKDSKVGYPIGDVDDTLKEQIKVSGNIGKAYYDDDIEILSILNNNLTYDEYIYDETIGSGTYQFKHYLIPSCITLNRILLPEEALGLYVADEIIDGVPYYNGSPVDF